jgi:ubiquinone/menaquinone biosynthesis C-methylase UbiE/uncharacterized protein YbaR (Trm112 family)
LRASLVRLLACPVCRSSLTYSGQTSRARLLDGALECPEKHLFHVKKGIPILKEPKMSRDEFKWAVEFPDVRRYDDIQRQYKSYLSDRQIQADERMMGEMVKRTPKDEVTLDIASGMGTFLRILSKHRTGTQIIGTDVDETPLRGAMLKLREEGAYGRVSLCVMDAKRLAVKSNKVKCAVSHFGFNNIPQTGKAFSEVCRVLKNKGMLMFSALFLQEDSRSLKLAGRLGYGEIVSEKRLAKALEQAGLQIDDVEEFYSGKWPHNPMDRLPLEGDWFAHSLVRASVA